MESKEKYLNRKIIKSDKTINYCSSCGKEISYKSKGLCVDCAHESSRRVEWPSRNELKDLIRNNSFLQIGKMYNVSDNTIRKWCISYNLPNKVGDIKKISNDEWINI